MAPIPANVVALLTALKFRSSQREGLRHLSDSEWRDLLQFSDMSHLTMPAVHTLREHLPHWVQERIDRNLSDNTERFRRNKNTYTELAGALHLAGAEHLVLKGFAQWPASMQHPRFRMQSDIDLYCPVGSDTRAMDALSRLGYSPSSWALHSPSDQHLPTMSREGNCLWTGNFFDPEMPLSVDIHLRFWNEETSYVSIEGLEQFWRRRTLTRVDEITFPALDQIDSLGYSALHAFRHLCYSSLLASHLYELAWFLHTTAENRSFWSTWRLRHDDRLRLIEAVCFSIAQLCFDCNVPGEVEEEIDRLSPTLQQCIQRCANSALYGLFKPNKDALWLHLSLVECSKARRTVLLRNLAGTRITPVAAFADGASPPEAKSEGTQALTRKYWKYGAHVVRRLRYHGSQLPSVFVNGIRWWWSTKELDPQFWTFYAASFCFDLGMFVFFFLFNLYLLDLGFTTKFLGWVTGAMAAGSIAGALPAGTMVQRLGIQRTMMLCFTSVAVLLGLRTLFTGETPQLCLAFLGGMASCIWAVAIAPALAHLTDRKNRAFGFSLVFSFGIGEGALGGLIGGTLPGWLARIFPLANAADLKRIALLIAAVTVLAAVWPASRLRFPRPPAGEARVYSKSQFLPRFLVAIALWSLVTGAFSPFFNVFFSQHMGMPIRQIGVIAAASQISQVVAILAVPYLFRKFGLVSGITYTQLAAAGALLCLAWLPGPSRVAIAYIGYMAFLWMSEPGMYSLLMSKMMPSERGGASAMNFLIISVAQAIAAVMAGSSYDRYGFPAVLSATALLAVLAAGCFRFLVEDERQSALEHPTGKLELQTGSD